MTDAKRPSGSRNRALGASCLMLVAVAWGGIPRDWGCCPGCMNGGLLGSDGEALSGTGAQAMENSGATPPKLGSSRRDRTFDLYERPPGGMSTGTSATPPAATARPVALPAVSGSAPAAQSSPASEATPAEPPKAGADGVLTVGFAELAGFPYTPPRPNDAPMQGVPPSVRALDGRKVRVTGYMLPIALEAGRCLQFLILRSQMGCCYGTMPQPTEWIVATSAKGVRPAQDVPLSFAGILRVGANFKQGVFTGIYNLEVNDALGR